MLQMYAALACMLQLYGGARTGIEVPCKCQCKTPSPTQSPTPWQTMQCSSPNNTTYNINCPVECAIDIVGNIAWEACMDVHLCADELEKKARVYHVSAHVSAYACCCSSSMQEHPTCSSAQLRCEPPFKHYSRLLGKQPERHSAT